jgi:uncharacterized protein DUF4124
MGTKASWIFGLTAALPLDASCAIYRCTAPDGSVTYQETACAGSTTGGVANIPTAYPDYNVVEHERILQREALLDERLMRRAALESAERIARDDRIAREKEAQARLAQAQAAAAGGVPYFLVRPAFAPRPPARHPGPRGGSGRAVRSST